MKKEKKLLENYFLERLPDRIPSSEVFEILLVVLEERPGSLVMSPDYRDRKLLREFCHELELEYFEVEEKKRSLIDRLLGRDTRTFKGGFFIARDTERFEILKSSKGRFYGFSDEAVGKFLGFPEDDIDYFSRRAAKGEVWDETEEKVNEMIQNKDVKRNDVKYLGLTSYVPRPEKSNILKAVNKGRKREKTLLEFDERFDTEIGERYLAEQLGQTAI